MKEIPLTLLMKAITPRRVTNVGRAVFSYCLSTILKRTVVWGQPFILTVEPTNVCNLKCPLCVTGNGRLTRQAGVMTYELFKEILDDVSDRVIYLLLYHQGEPYLNRDFLKFVEYAKAKRIFVTTSTNAHYLDAETAERTVASKLDSLIISMDGVDQETYATYRVGGNLEKVRQGVRNLVEAKQRLGRKTPIIYVQFLVMRQNEQQLKEMQKLTRELGADQFLMKTVQVESLEEARTWLPGEKAHRRYHENEKMLETKRLVNGPCPRPWTSTLVNCDGTVVPCCFDKNARHRFGKIGNQETLSTIWQSHDYEDFRDQMLENREGLDICSNCSQGIRLFI